jgi:peptidoglycan hydrolase CwlO-like protein
MVEITNELIFQVLKEVQSGQTALRAEVTELRGEVSVINRKLGVVAENLNSMRQDLHKLQNDVQVIALAVDEHSHRLDALEARSPTLQS